VHKKEKQLEHHVIVVFFRRLFSFFSFHETNLFHAINFFIGGLWVNRILLLYIYICLYSVRDRVLNKSMISILLNLTLTLVQNLF
jgi:hypothetical protein